MTVQTVVYSFRFRELAACYNERFTVRVYFDYNATTPAAPEVVDAVVRVTRDVFGNASSVHHFGQEAKAVLDEARSAVAALIAADPSEIVFTSGGTEADNFAIRGAAAVFETIEPSRRKHHLIAGAIEHEEHLLVGVVIVKREGALAWRHRGHVVAQLARAEVRCDRGELRLESFAVAKVATEHELIEIDDGRAHGRHSSSVQ